MDFEAIPALQISASRDSGEGRCDPVVTLLAQRLEAGELPKNLNTDRQSLVVDVSLIDNIFNAQPQTS